MTTTSFLHAASARAIADQLRGGPSGDGTNITSAGGNGSDGLRGNDASKSPHVTGALRMLLVEEEEAAPNTNNGTPYGGRGNLARSLAMDAACSLVANSTLPCRGCGEDGVAVDDMASHGSNEMTPGKDAQTKACRCCKVALLVPGEPSRRRKGKKRRRRGNGHGSIFLGGGHGAEFPLSCVRIGDNDDEGWDPALLGHIQIKYVNSLKDVIAYLAYAPSLPEHMQPLDGMFILGLGELLSREGKRASSVMEFTHVCSLLAGTANYLDDGRRDVLKTNNGVASSSLDDSNGHMNFEGGSISIIATIDKFTFSSMPEKVVRYLHQWMDVVAELGPVHVDAMPDTGEDDTEGSEWELAFKNMGLLEQMPRSRGSAAGQESSFGFNVAISEGDGYQISWNVPS